MKKVVSLFLAVAMLILPLISMADEPATIEVAVNYTDAQLETFSALIDKFTEETGIKVELVTPGSDFETQLKTMMASNQLPDVWTTHGWSLNRYSGYLKPVNDQEWFGTIDTNALGGVMADENGTFYALGLSCVRLESVDITNEGPVLHVSGADLMDGTPIFDIKPYVPYADAHPEASGGFTDDREFHRLSVNITHELELKISEDDRAALIGVLSNDPRPQYHNDPERVYGFRFGEREIKFKVSGDELTVVDII